MNWKKLWLTVAIAALITAVVPTTAQAVGLSGSIHGHVNDPTGVSITDGIISLLPEGSNTAKYTFKTDDNGDYKGSGIAVGTYTVTMREANTPAGQVIDQFDNVKIQAAKDTTQNFDLSRPAYLKKLTPEQRKQIEEVKKANAKILKQNAVIKNLNKDLKQARKDNESKNYAAAEALMKKDTAVMPNQYLLWVELGTAQLGQKKYDDAIASLNKAISQAKANKKPNMQVVGVASNALGEAYGDAGQFQKADAVYAAAAQADPPNAVMYYTNEAIVMNRNGQADMTLKAANNAIKADPSKALPYYLKGQALVQKATVNKAGKVIAPPGCVEAYKKYLKLAPNTPEAGQVRAILKSLGQK